VKVWELKDALKNAEDDDYVMVQVPLTTAPIEVHDAKVTWFHSRSVSPDGKAPDAHYRMLLLET